MRASGFRDWLKAVARNAWLFPIIATLALILLTSLRVSGSSIGIYHSFFNGGERDPNLIANEPRSIRSDEWLVNSQMTLAQLNNGFKPEYENIGNGQDMTVLMDVPYEGWSTIFRPQNIAFHFLPFDYAFAFRWWFVAYALVLSAYLFAITLMPGRYLVASLISMGLFFSPFIHWWYGTGTLGPIYLTILGVTCAFQLIRAQTNRQILGRGLALAYVATSFALVFYPPFQLACLIVGLGVLTGLVIEEAKVRKWSVVLKRIPAVVLAVALSGLLVFSFLNARLEVIRAVTGTVYPGEREVLSGGYSVTHMFSGHLSAPLQDDDRAQLYSIPAQGIANQSEASSFILIFLLVLPLILIYQIASYRKAKSIDWPLLASGLVLLYFLVRFFVPNSDQLYRPLLINTIPHTRLLIGLGLLNFFALVFIARSALSISSDNGRSIRAVLISVICFCMLLYIGLNLRSLVPGYIDLPQLLVYTLLAVIVIFLCQIPRTVVLGTAILLILSISTTYNIHPLYRGTAVLSEAPLGLAMKQVSAHDPDSRWIVEGIMLENFALANGIPSLSGVYAYPQHKFWSEAGFSDQEDIYNRYAHFNVELDRDPLVNIDTELRLVQPDSFLAVTEPCSDFLRREKVGYLVTVDQLLSGTSCSELIATVTYPVRDYYIYRFNYE